MPPAPKASSLAPSICPFKMDIMLAPYSAWFLTCALLSVITLPTGGLGEEKMIANGEEYVERPHEGRA